MDVPDILSRYSIIAGALLLVCLGPLSESSGPQRIRKILLAMLPIVTIVAIVELETEAGFQWRLSHIFGLFFLSVLVAKLIPDTVAAAFIVSAAAFAGLLVVRIALDS